MIAITGLFLFGVNFWILSSTKSLVCSEKSSNISPRVGLVFGARVYSNGRPSDILRDRLDGAIKSYQAKEISKILVSGDNGRVEYDEPSAMKDYLIKANIPEKDIFLDYAGFDTYDSIYRAREIFGVQDVVLFTQAFHLPRALFIAKNLGIHVCGVPTDYHQYINETRNHLREVLARTKAWFDIYVWHAKPKFLGEKVIIN